MFGPRWLSAARQSRVHGRTAQHGFSLLEVLISIFLIGTVVLALAAGMLTMLRMTHRSAESQRLQVAMTSFTESLAAVPYLKCAGTPQPTVANYQSAYDGLNGEWNRSATTGPTGTITAVEYWQDDSSITAPTVPAQLSFGDYVATCPAADRGRQRLTVQVQVNGKVRTGQIVIAPPGPVGP